ncbi:MAG: ATP-grasp domain-containing protein [Angustibacter sp.]
MTPTVIYVNSRPTRSEAEPPYWAAAALGLRVVSVGDVAPPVPASLYHEFVRADTYDFAALRAVAAELATRHEIVGVVCWGDRDVEGVAHIAEELGLPGNSPAAAARARNKRQARQALAAHDERLIPRYVGLRTLAELDAALTDFPLPAVLKPAGASASRGIFTIHDREQAHAAATKLFAFTDPAVDPIFRHYPGELLLEEFMTGTEHSVEGIVIAGELVTSVITDKFIDPAFSIETYQLQPSGLTAEQGAACVAAAQSVVTALGLGTTAIHLELKVDGDRVRVIECNARTAGGYITTHLIPLTCGYDFLKNVLLAHCNLGPIAPIPPAYVFAGSRQHLARGSGKLSALTGIDAVLGLPGVAAVFMDSALGRPVAQPPSDFTSSVLASVVAVCGSRAELDETLLRADDLLQDVTE